MKKFKFRVFMVLGEMCLMVLTYSGDGSTTILVLTVDEGGDGGNDI